MRDRRHQSVLVLSGHASVREGIAAVLRERDHLQVTAAEDYVHFRVRRADVAIVDLDHAAIDTMKLIQQLRAQLDGTFVIAVGQPTRIAASVNGAAADVELEASRADVATLVAAIARKPVRPSNELARAHRIWSEVTPRQREVMRWLASGLDNPGIADRMGVGERAVKAHVSALLALFGCSNRTQLALFAHKAGCRPIAVR